MPRKSKKVVKAEPKAVETVEEARPVEVKKKLSDDENREIRLKQKPVVREIPKEVPEYDLATQRLFEAPDGAILVGDKDRTFMIYKVPGTNETMRILPRREPISIDEVAKKNLLKEEEKRRK